MEVRALRDCFVGSYHKKGEVFDYTGPKNENLKPVEAQKETSDVEGAKAPKRAKAPK